LARIGSTGAGVNIEHGVVTRVAVRKGLKPRVSVMLNGRRLVNAVVSKRVINEYLLLYREPWTVKVDYICDLPVGRGYGTSGAGAASLTLALNDALGNPLGRIAAFSVAHKAEVKARTGLGTVAAVSEGGLAVRVKPGAPGIGEVRKLSVPESLRVVSGSFGPIPTVTILSSRSLTHRVNVCSRRLVENLLRRPEERNFLRLSRSFADCLCLGSRRVSRALALAERHGVVASMMMLGDGVFSLVPSDSVQVVAGLMRSTGFSTISSRIYSRGAHLV